VRQNKGAISVNMERQRDGGAIDLCEQREAKTGGRGDRFLLTERPKRGGKGDRFLLTERPKR
jgi:hypothetical protein